jgi:hypothetical protein
MNCPHCGSSNLASAKFCKSCGKTLPISKAKSSEYCPNCGHSNVAGAKFCGKCGETLGTRIPTRSATRWFVAGATLIFILLACALATAATPALAASLPEFIGTPLTTFIENTGLHLPPAMQQLAENLFGGFDDAQTAQIANRGGDPVTCGGEATWPGEGESGNYLVAYNQYNDPPALTFTWEFTPLEGTVGGLSNYQLVWELHEAGNPQPLISKTVQEENELGEWCETGEDGVRCSTFFEPENEEDINDYLSNHPLVAVAGLVEPGTGCVYATQSIAFEGENDAGYLTRYHDGQINSLFPVYRDGQIQARFIVYRDGSIELLEDGQLVDQGDTTCVTPPLTNMQFITTDSDDYDWFGFIELRAIGTEGPYDFYGAKVLFIDALFNWKDGSSEDAYCHIADGNGIFCGTLKENFYRPLEASQIDQLQTLKLSWSGSVPSGDGWSLYGCENKVTSSLPMAQYVELEGQVEEIQEQGQEALEAAQEAAGAGAAISGIFADNVTATGTSNSNCRSGPGTAYDNIGTLFSAQAKVVVGRLSNNSWVAIQHPNNASGFCWVSNGANIQIDGDLNSVDILSAPPLPADEGEQTGGEESQGEGSGVDSGSDSPSTVSVSFSVRNKTGSSICSVKISEADQNNYIELFAPAELDNNGTKSLTATILAGEYYDLRASNCAEGSGGQAFYIYDAQISSGALYVFLP